MKICTVCQRCYEDSAETCGENHGSLVAERAGTGRMIANYRLDFLYERDAAGDRYLATHITLDQPFVVGIISQNVIIGAGEQARQTFLSETQAAANIFHPNLARVYESGSLESGEFYTVTELIGGRTLHEYLKDAGSLPAAEAILIARQTAEALEAAHNAGVIHRAVNPSNIILNRDEDKHLSVKLQNFDFGGFKQKSMAGNKSPAEQSQIDALQYLSPEQRAAEAVDARTDIYSLAFVLYETLCERPPFDTPTSQQINEQPLERLPFDIKALLTHILKSSLQQRPEARPPKTANFVRLLRHIEQVIKPLSVPFLNVPQPSFPMKIAPVTAVNFNHAPLPEIKEPTSETSQTSVMNTRESSGTVDQSPVNSEIWQPLNPIIAQSPIPVEEIKENPADLKSVFSPNPEWTPVNEKVNTVDKSVFSSEPEWIPVKDADLSADPFAAEPIFIMNRETDVAVAAPPFEPEPIIVEQKQFEGTPLESEQITTNRVQVRVAPIGAETSPAPDVRNTQRTQTVEPNFINADGENRPPRRFAPTRQSLFIGAGLGALIVFAILSALLFYRQFQLSPSGQIIADASSASSAPQPPQTTSETKNDTAAVTDSDIAETEENAPLPFEETPSTTSKRENPDKTRQENLTDNIADEQSESVREQTARETALPTEVERFSTDGNNKEIQSREVTVGGAPQTELNASLDKWINATNARDVEQQMNYYAPKVDSFYRARNASLETVRAEKNRVFERADAISIKASKPEIDLSPDGRSATMRFRKKYLIKEGQRSRNGEVLQELRWVKSGSDWRIVSERDVKVINR